MNNARTSLSAGLIVMGMLQEAGVAARAFPIAAQEAELPYIVYQRVAAKANPTKGLGSADAATVEVTVWAATVMESIELAEAVRAALDGRSYERGGLACRRCLMADSSEGWEADAYFQRMAFEMAIGK